MSDINPRLYVLDGKWFCDVVIIDKTTGERRLYADKHGCELKYDSFDGREWWWEEGNYSCDCNRHLAFGHNEEYPCGQERYDIELPSELRALADRKRNGEKITLEELTR